MNFGHKSARKRNPEYTSLSVSGRKNYHTQRKSVKTNDVSQVLVTKKIFMMCVFPAVTKRSRVQKAPHLSRVSGIWQLQQFRPEFNSLPSNSVGRDPLNNQIPYRRIPLETVKCSLALFSQNDGTKDLPLLCLYLS